MNENEGEIPFIKPELSIQECREFLCKDGEEYTDEEIKEIRALIINLVEIDFCFYMKCKRQKREDCKIIDLEKRDTNPGDYKEAG